MRNYQDKKVSQELLNQILEAGRMAPTGDIDTAIVADHMILEAEDLGLGSCWLARFNPDILREEFLIPQNIEPVIVVAFGYPKLENRVRDWKKQRKALVEIVVYESF